MQNEKTTLLKITTETHEQIKINAALAGLTMIKYMKMLILKNTVVEKIVKNE
jgi:hypothetical protein